MDFADAHPTLTFHPTKYSPAAEEKAFLFRSHERTVAGVGAGCANGSPVGLK